MTLELFKDYVSIATNAGMRGYIEEEPDKIRLYEPIRKPAEPESQDDEESGDDPVHFFETLLAEALGLEWDENSRVSFFERLVRENNPWVAFPGLEQEGLLTKGEKLRKDPELNPNTIVYRKLNAAPIADQSSRKLAESLPSAAASSTPSQSKSSKTTSSSQPPESKIFALPGDRIMSLYYLTASSDSKLGLSKGDRVLLVDLNTSTGLCRILSSKGWHLHQLDQSSIERIGPSVGVELSIDFGRDPWPKGVEWPEEEGGMYRAMVKAIEKWVPATEETEDGKEGKERMGDKKDGGIKSEETCGDERKDGTDAVDPDSVFGSVSAA